MIEDLQRSARASEGKDASPPNESDVVQQGESHPVTGQAGEAITIERPAPSETLEIQAASGQTYVLTFPPGDARVRIDGADFILSFDQNGDGTADSEIVFRDLARVVKEADAPVFQMAGTAISSDALLERAAALAELGSAPLNAAAANPGAPGGGATEYSDNVGTTIDLLTAEDVIDPTELQFGLTDPEDETTLMAASPAEPGPDDVPGGGPGDGPGDEGPGDGPVDVPVLVIGENVDDVPGATTPHHEHYPETDQNAGEITGNAAGDVLIGDVGGASLVNKTMNLALVLDTSGSMGDKVKFEGKSTTRIEALDKAVERVLDDLTATEGATVRLHMVSFASTVKATATFDIIVNGTVDAEVLQAAKDFILDAGDDPRKVASGDTNYEAGLGAALDWFSDDARTLDNPDFNQTLFISDGMPNRVFVGDAQTKVVNPGSNQAALDHVLGVSSTPKGKVDTISEYDGLLGSFKGVAATVDAIGINVAKSGDNILNQVDDDGNADNVTSGDQLRSVLSDLAQMKTLAAVGNDLLVGDDGDDVIFGDALFTDILAEEQGIDLPSGSSWEVINNLAGGGFFDSDPAKPLEEEIQDFLIDPATRRVYDLGRESAADGLGRTGGNDSIDGGAGDDVIFGQEGNDLIIGGSGDDTLSGGSGQDVFLWGATTAESETDTVIDFQLGPGGDQLNLDDLLPELVDGSTAPAGLAEYLSFSSDGTNTTMHIEQGSGPSATTVNIVLGNVGDLTAGGTHSDQQILQQLVDDGNLAV